MLLFSALHQSKEINMSGIHWINFFNITSGSYGQYTQQGILLKYLKMNTKLK